MFLPNWRCETIYDIDFSAIGRMGIRLLLCDLDNTIAPYGVPEPSEEMLRWFKDAENKGLKIFIISNNRGKTRVSRFCAAAGLPFISRAGKPGRKAFQRALRETGFSENQTLMIGDQIFTDIYGARRAGIGSILVRSIDVGYSPMTAARYIIELPILAVAKLLRKDIGEALL